MARVVRSAIMQVQRIPDVMGDNLIKDAREETIQGGKLFGHIIKFITVFRYSYSDKITAAIKAQAKRKY